MPSILHLLAIHARRKSPVINACAYLATTLQINVFDVKRVQVTWNDPQKCEKDVDEQVGAAAGDEEDA